MGIEFSIWHGVEKTRTTRFSRWLTGMFGSVRNSELLCTTLLHSPRRTHNES
jgi:hypothetical protein